jgi:hypothetical protein
MLRAPLSLAKMTYDAASGTVIYRSKMHLGLKRNFQVMPGAEWLGLLCKHIPDRYEQLVRYVGWYSSRSRGVRKAKGAGLPHHRLTAVSGGRPRPYRRRVPFPRSSKGTSTRAFSTARTGASP